MNTKYSPVFEYTADEVRISVELNTNRVSNQHSQGEKITAEVLLYQASRGIPKMTTEIPFTVPGINYRYSRFDTEDPDVYSTGDQLSLQ